MANLLNSTKAAQLIESQTGRRCTRQNLEKLCDKGALHGSSCVVQQKPWRLDADLVVGEYLAKVAPHQAEAEQPRSKRERPAQSAGKPPAQQPGQGTDDLPDYTISRARSEYEKANLLELQRREKERELLNRDDVKTAWQNAVNLTRTKLLGVPSTAKARIPHLETEEVEVLTLLIREALEELAAGEVAP